MVDHAAGARVTESPPSGHARCVACLEPINSGAGVCHHCGTSQRISIWGRVSEALKWVGGIVTVISLIVGATTLTGYFSDWRGRNAAVADLVESAGWLVRSAHYPQAWDALDDALALSPGAAQARRTQHDLALVWARNFKTSGDPAKDDVRLAAMTAVLYRSLAGASPGDIATSLAHLGWIQQRRFRLGLGASGDIAALFEQALASEPGNVFANAMLANWLLMRVDRHIDAEVIALQEARFETALRRPETRPYVRRLQVAAFADIAHGQKSEADALALIALLGALVEMQRNGEAPPADWVVSNLFRSAYGDSQTVRHVERAIAAVPPADHVAVIDWLTDGHGADGVSGASARHTVAYVYARLYEASGEKARAESAYHALLAACGERCYATLEARVRERLSVLSGSS